MKPRINCIINEIKYKTLGDIGTDHGYIPILAKEKNIIDYAIAVDINMKPLQVAKKNIQVRGLNKFIECRLGSGLSVLKNYEVETVSICGMGGTLIINILKENESVLNSIKQLVLQPQGDILNLRKFVHKVGFKIYNEEMVQEGNKFYTIINCLKGKEKYKEDDYLLGIKLVEKKSEVLKLYMEIEINKINKILSKIKKEDENIKVMLNKLKILRDTYKLM